MSSDSDQNDSSDSWLFYRERPEWRDIKPVQQNDLSIGIVAIAYSEKFADVYDYFRAILQAEEKSQRAFDLTTDAIKLNPANYTVWQYRRDIIKHLSLDLHAEMKFVENIILKLPKNYQVWHHRHVLVQWTQDPSEELSLTERVLEQDAKNYHAWQHRHWVILEFKLYEKELEYTNSLLNEDVRNNSAWNERFYIIKIFYRFDMETLKSEIKYTLQKIKLVKNNESAWNYLRGMINHNGSKLSDHPDVQTFCESLCEQGYKESCLISYLFDLYHEQFLSDKSNKHSYHKAMECLELLSLKCDKIRYKYWTYLKHELQREYDTYNN